MTGIVFWIMVLAVLVGVAAVAAVFLKAHANGQTPREVFFKQRPDPRLGVVEYANVDGKRKLVLIRRDDVEHLIMTGGPVDMVIETGIGEPPRVRAPSDGPHLTPPTFSRPPRGQFGTAPAVVAAREDEADLAMKR